MNTKLTVFEMATLAAREQLRFFTEMMQDKTEASMAVGSNDLLERWIPVDESLPEEAVWVLAWERWSENPFVGCRYLGRWTVSHEHVEAEGGWNGAIVVDDLSKPCSVTHWMPLPAPPAL